MQPSPGPHKVNCFFLGLRLCFKDKFRIRMWYNVVCKYKFMCVSEGMSEGSRLTICFRFKVLEKIRIMSSHVVIMVNVSV